jgi:hypothetical protein
MNPTASSGCAARAVLRGAPVSGQAGRTIIELMVAIALGMLILLGVGTLFVGANQTARMSTSVATTEEGGSIILTLMGDAIRRAGYGEIVAANSFTIAGNSPQATQATLLFSGRHLLGCSGGRFANPEAGDFTCVAGGVGDALAVWFQADNVVASNQGPTLDCLGNNPATLAIGNPALVGAGGGAGTLPVVNNVYFVNNGSLMCQGNDETGAAGAPPAPLVDNVVDFRVFYGFDDVGFANPMTMINRPTPRRMVDAATLNGLPNIGNLTAWDYVVSVHVCLTLRTQEAGVSTQPAQQYRPCPRNEAEAAGVVPLVNAPAGGAIYRSYSQVFTVRSRATPSPMRPT